MTLPRSTEAAWLFFAIAKDIAPRDIAKYRRRDCHVRFRNAIFRLDRFACRGWRNSRGLTAEGRLARLLLLFTATDALNRREAPRCRPSPQPHRSRENRCI